MKSKAIAGLASAVFPGLGQFLVGRRERGLAILAGWLVIPALYGIIMVLAEQVARSYSIGEMNLLVWLSGRFVSHGQVDLPSLFYAFLGLVLYWLLNICDAVLCARDAR